MLLQELTPPSVSLRRIAQPAYIAKAGLTAEQRTYTLPAPSAGLPTILEPLDLLQQIICTINPATGLSSFRCLLSGIGVFLFQLAKIRHGILPPKNR
jgi:hypothetical protein